MKKWAMIATWRMAVEGVTLGADILKKWWKMSGCSRKSNNGS